MTPTQYKRQKAKDEAKKTTSTTNRSIELLKRWNKYRVNEFGIELMYSFTQEPFNHRT